LSVLSAPKKETVNRREETVKIQTLQQQQQYSRLRTDLLNITENKVRKMEEAAKATPFRVLSSIHYTEFHVNPYVVTKIPQRYNTERQIFCSRKNTIYKFEKKKEKKMGEEECSYKVLVLSCEENFLKVNLRF
jgi:hypothetical protein